MTVSPVPTILGSATEITAEQYLEWSAHAHPGLVLTAFYQPNLARVRIGGITRSWSVGRASQSLPALLRIHISGRLLSLCHRTGAAPVILSWNT